MITGERLGPYEIVSLVGEGGMGRVYRARDPRLEQEGRAAAALNHPAILAVYDIGQTTDAARTSSRSC